MPDLASAAAPPGHTAFGGAFLLLPVLASMPFDEWVRGWPPVDGIAPACLVRALVLGTCLGPDLLGDPLWRDLLGLPGDIDWPAAGAALGALRPGALGGLRKGLRAHARDHGALPQLHKTVRAAGEDWRIDHDAEGYWHRIAVARPGRHRFAADADAHYLVSRLPLSLPLPLPPAWQYLLCQAAQQVLRRFARRLPGFALSHLDYLQANFLCLPATVEMRGTQVVAGLGRPPLALMLDLAGMTRTTFDLPWHPGRTCVLHAERA
jgi:hypothetical protein